jgi:hypothetical protein
VQFFDNGVAINGTQPVVVAAGGGSGTATLTTSFSTAGTHPITAQYLPAAGSPCPGATSPVFNETITAVTSSTYTTLSASPTDPSFGQPVTLTATVTCTGGGLTGGTVTFTDLTTGTTLGTTPVNPSTGVATLTVNGLTAGTHNISAHFNGTATCAPSASNTVTGATVNTCGSRFFRRRWVGRARRVVRPVRR